MSDHSLCFGWAGIGLGWLTLHRANDDGEDLKQACAAGDRVAGASPGLTEFLYGGAGEGIFLLRLWERTKEPRFRDAALARVDWLDRVKTESETGVHWPPKLGGSGRVSLGFGHGLAGIGYFLALAHQLTNAPPCRSLVEALARTLMQSAVSDRGGLNWPRVLGDDSRPLRCQWCHGAPGVGLFFVRAYKALGDPAYLATAKAAAEATYRYGDVRQNPCQCHGLSGNAELFIELHRMTGDELWLHRAHEFAELALAYRSTTIDGERWQADEPGYYSPDFLCGAAGAGHFFLRLLAPREVGMALL